MYCISDLFDVTHTLAKPLFEQAAYPFDVLNDIKEFIKSEIKRLGAEYIEVSPSIWVHRTAKIMPSAHVCAPCIIGAETEIRHCAFIRGCAIVGDGCVVGNSSELKNVILFDGVQVPHFNYVGDSILGYKAHMGAGAVTSNVKSDKSEVVVKCGEIQLRTNRKKVGAMIGDYAEIGCNCVLNPGTVIGRNSVVYPLSSVRGTVPEGSIFKSHDCIVLKK